MFSMTRSLANKQLHKTFIDDLKNHVLSRLYNHGFTGSDKEFSDDEREQLIIHNNLIYRHSLLRVNYTTYNVQRDQDVISPRIPSRSFVMMPAADDDDDDYWYAKVLGIYHVRVIHPPTGGNTPQTLQFLWIRWLGSEPGYGGGLKKARLPRVGYIQQGPGAFGFLDPANIIRGALLIPAFSFGITNQLLPLSGYWDTKEGDWESYYVAS